jgi:hypothetical protein
MCTLTDVIVPDSIPNSSSICVLGLFADNARSAVQMIDVSITSTDVKHREPSMAVKGGQKRRSKDYTWKVAF